MSPPDQETVFKLAGTILGRLGEEGFDKPTSFQALLLAAIFLHRGPTSPEKDMDLVNEAPHWIYAHGADAVAN